MGPDLDPQSFAKVISRRLCMAKSTREGTCKHTETLSVLNLAVDDLN